MRVILGLIALVSCAAAVDFSREGLRWWSHIQVLADDNLEGRNTGSEGHGKAAKFVAKEFQRAGLKPAGTSGYLQTVGLEMRQLDEEASSLALVTKGNVVVPLTLGDHANIGFGNDLAAVLEAPAVFVGNGLVIPERGIDDLAGLDLKGKIAVYLNGGPSSVPSALKAHYSSRGQRWKALQKAGAVGLASIANPRSMDIPWSRSTLARLSPTMTLADPKLLEVLGLQFSISINPDRAEIIFPDSGHTFAEILALANADKPLPTFPLNLSFRARVKLTHSELASPNVVGILPGTDPKLKNEYVVFSAHLDHLGVGQPINGDRIYNGAMDNASGVASLIEIATLLHDEKINVKRSVVFLAVTGEEKGELGSLYFAAHPTVPQKGIVADINLDMYLPLFPLKYLEVQGLDESSLGEDIRAACKGAGVTVQADKEPDRNLFIRSDQYSFVQKGVPALAFKFGYDAGSPEEKISKTWRAERYHAPSDDLNQPVDKIAAAQFNRILLDLGERVANAKDPPHWNPDSFFRRFATTNRQARTGQSLAPRIVKNR